jgi:hypothetical protein
MLRGALLPDTEVLLKHLEQHKDIKKAVKFIKADIMLREAVIMSQT